MVGATVYDVHARAEQGWLVQGLAASTCHALKRPHPRHTWGCIHPPAQGVAIVANKFKRVFATVVRDVDDAISARSADHSNVLCLGARVTTLPDAQE